MAENELRRRIKELAGIVGVPFNDEKLDSMLTKIENPETKNRIKEHIKFIADYICRK